MTGRLTVLGEGEGVASRADELLEINRTLLELDRALRKARVVRRDQPPERADG